MVTGGSKGIGKAIAWGLARAGADLFLCSRTDETLQAAMTEIRNDTGVRVEGMTVDMAQSREVEGLAVAAQEKYGQVDILVNNAGWNITAAIDQIKDEDWEYLVELNLNNVMRLTRAIVPGMKERGWGRVIHISSIMAFASTTERSGYSATKAALLGLAKASALDLGPYGITVNCIAPGPVATEMPMSILSKEQQDALASRTAVGRWGKPEEMAGAAMLLASDAGSFITGTCIVIDGGVTARVF